MFFLGKCPNLVACAQKNHKANGSETQTWPNNRKSIENRNTTQIPQTSKRQRRHVQLPTRWDDSSSFTEQNQFRHRTWAPHRQRLSNGEGQKKPLFGLVRMPGGTDGSLWFTMDYRVVSTRTSQLTIRNFSPSQKRSWRTSNCVCWLVVWNHGISWLSIQLGISSSQLTLTPSFFRGVGLNHQPDYCWLYLHDSPLLTTINHRGTMWGPPVMLYSWFRFAPVTISSTINHSEIGAMCTNLAIDWGPHIVGIPQAI